MVEVLKTSRDPIEIEAATYILLDAHYLDALPVFRELAGNRNIDIRRSAIIALGIFGHPLDYNFLISGLRSKDPRELQYYVWALGEYGDLIAVQHLILLLASEDPELRMAVVSSLHILKTPASFEALKKHSDTARDKKDAEKCEKIINHFLKEINLIWNEYLEKPREEK